MPCGWNIAGRLSAPSTAQLDNGAVLFYLATELEFEIPVVALLAVVLASAVVSLLTSLQAASACFVEEVRNTAHPLGDGHSHPPPRLTSGLVSLLSSFE